jgi:O-phosphoseryl-tRNA(Sec) kinase
MQQFLIALCGLPASGKTTLAYEIADALPNESKVVIVSTDAWRDQAYYANFKPQKEKEVRNEALRETYDKLKQEFSVIHDDTNYYASMRHELLELAQEFNCIFAVVYVSTDISDALRWNKERESDIPQKVIRRIHARFDIPGSKYSWDEPIFQVDMAENNVQNVAKEIAHRISSLELVNISQPDTETTNPVDVATRELVADFLSEHKDLRNSPKVSSIRKSIVGRANRKGWSTREALDALTSELESLLEE